MNLPFDPPNVEIGTRQLYGASAVLVALALVVLVFALARLFKSDEDPGAFGIFAALTLMSLMLFGIASVTAVGARRWSDDEEKEMLWRDGFEQLRLEAPMVAFRVYGDADQRWGRWVTLRRPSNPRSARRGMALPSTRRARCLTLVEVDSGIEIRIGRAGARLGSPGGWNQIEILGSVRQLASQKKIRFSRGMPLASNARCGRPEFSSVARSSSSPKERAWSSSL